MREAGLRTWLDAVGNVHGRVDGRAREAPAFILGSHYDTVMDAGKYDGALGIIVAIASVKASILQVSAVQLSGATSSCQTHIMAKMAHYERCVCKVPLASSLYTMLAAAPVPRKPAGTAGVPDNLWAYSVRCQI